MKIRNIEAFQVQWAPEDNPAQRSAWVRVHCDDGSSGIGEASPMQGGLASLGIVKHNLAPALIGKDPLDHAVLLDTLLHTFVKLGPEGALTGALGGARHCAVGFERQAVRSADLQITWRRLAHQPAVLRLDRRQWRAQCRRGAARCRSAAAGQAGGGEDPLRQRPHQAGHRHSGRYCQGARGSATGRG